MATTDPYMDLDEFKARTNIDDDDNDAVILQALLAASRQIENMTGRNFNQSAATAKFITAIDGRSIFVPDLVSVSAIATDDGNRTYTTTWATTDYDLWPFDAVDAGQPYRKIQLAPNGANSFPYYARGVRVTGIWGWPDIPQTVIEATALLANRIKSLWNAPFGQTGAGEMGAGLNMTAAMTPLIKEMLKPYAAVAGF